MRYFLISFQVQNKFGSFLLESAEFPSYKVMSEVLGLSSFIVINVFEFKSLEDFNNFSIGYESVI